MAWPTIIYTPVVAVRVVLVQLRRPLHRAHGGMDHILPNGLEEVPPVGAGGNGVLTGTVGEDVVLGPLDIAGGIVINNHSIFSWIVQDEPDIDYETWHYPTRESGWNGWIISIQPHWPFDDLVFLAIDQDGNLEDYLDG